MKFYVINLPRCADRKERISKRLAYHGILDQTTFVDAIDKNSPIVEWFESGNTIPRTSTRAEHACFLSHIKALRLFVEDSTTDTAIILEDDAILCNSFVADLAFVRDKTRDQPLVMICAYVSSWHGVKSLGSFLGVEREYKLHTIQPMIYGTQGYLITKKGAYDVLCKLDTNLRNISTKRITSELITTLSGGCFVMPPLVIEESLYTNIQAESQMLNHRKYFSSFGLDNYRNGDGYTIDTLWPKDESTGVKP